MDTTPRSRLIVALFGALALPGVARSAPLASDPYQFLAIYETADPSGRATSRVAQFTPQGPIAGTIGGQVNDVHVAYDPVGHTYYAQAQGGLAARLDPATGAATPLPDTDAELTDHPTGLTFDTKRNCLVLSTLGGEGFLLAYSPATNAWSRLASLNNVDLYSLTYSAADDAYYGLTRSGIVRYTPAGQPAGSVNLDPSLPGLDLWKAQLVATGDRLALLTQPVGDTIQPNLTRVQRSYLVDPGTGLVTAIGPVQVVPEPATASVVLALTGVAIGLRRRGR